MSANLYECLGCAGGILEKVGKMFVEFIDIAEKNLGVNFLLAVEIEVNRSLAQFGFFGDALDGDRAEALLEKKPPCRLQDGIFPIFPLSFSSFFQSQDLIPSVLMNGLTPYIQAGDTDVNCDATAPCRNISKR